MSADLERLLDQVTVLYKARVEDLAPQARVVLDAVALAWNPITAADVAAATALDTSAVSTQLDRLQKNGVVEKVGLSSTARAGFQLGERFFNIWYLMRHGPRRQKTRLRWLTSFLRDFYSPAQLNERALELLKGNNRQGLERGHYALALCEAIDDEGLRHLLTQEARAEFEHFAAASGKRLEDIVDPEDLPTPSTASEWAGMGWWLIDLGRYNDAETAYRQAIKLYPNDPFSWNALGILLRKLARYDEAEAAYRQAIILGFKSASPWNNLGNLLGELARYDEAEAAYRQAIALDSNDATPWNNLGFLLQDHLARYEEAEAAYQRALDLGTTPEIPQTNLLFLYYIKPDRYGEAESLFETLVDRLPSPGPDLLRAFRALALDNFGETTQALASALAGNPAVMFMNYHLLRVLRLAAARGYGDKLLAWLDEQGYADHYWPLRVAFDAYLHGEAKLMDVNPEVRGAAKRIYDWLDSARRAQTATTEESGKAPPPKRKKGARKTR